MLKGIPEILSPELLKVLCEMGHSDRLVIADGNFPVESMGKNAITIRCDGHGVPEILEAILKVFPLDTYVEQLLEISSVSHSMTKQKQLTVSSPQVRKLCTQTLCCRRVLSSTTNFGHLFF